ncbi:unnamed protein product [Enterobius vermicularis]|uniref:Mitochondrial carrier protein n=1 Tax=Enterobius vermicularis TaxID=51028 RepID=A0A0N4UZI1_ENTVE|nr:unnamed protein product [Enterobius vermicularis]
MRWKKKGGKLYGWLDCGVSLLVGHPLDTIKTRLQTMNMYAGFQDCLTKTVTNESMFGLYKGMFLPFVSAGALHSLLFASYATTLKCLKPERVRSSNNEELPLREIVLATLVSAVVQLIPGIPIELVKTKLQFKLCIFFLMAFSLCILNNKLVGYICCRLFLQALAGGTAGSLSWISICPFEVMKNRSQTQSDTANRQLLQTAKQILKNDGISGFYKGCVTLIVRGFIVNSVLFVVYEKTLAFVEHL